jgi:hypothetical protein
MKTYVVTVMKNSGNKLVDVRGRKGLKQLIESLGLDYSGLQTTHASRGVDAQVHMEWSDPDDGKWSDGQIVRDHIFKHAA